MAPTFRVPVAIVPSLNGAFHHVYCNDGTVWRRNTSNDEWQLTAKPLPGSRAALGLDSAAEHQDEKPVPERET